MGAGGRLLQAFALIELLVVIGIVALLIAVLLPALAGARRSAQSAACLSNLRQLAIAAHLYCDANKGRLPRPAQNGLELPEDWVHYQPGRWPYYRGTVAEHLPDAVMKCPADNQRPHVRPYPFSYSINASLARLIYYGPPLRMSQIRRPSETILFVCESANTIDDGAWAWAVTQGNGANRLAITRHDIPRREGNIADDGWGQVAYADGHAGRILRSESFAAGVP